MYKGVFYMHGFKGFFVNIITVCWLTFAIVFFSFPYYKPVTAANMNYTCLVVGGLTLVQLAWYIKVRSRYNECIQRAKEE
ncbi:unnamed protein product [Aureobasidium uvarum]|uniref:Uncharacterized protein n=1 Tax=Aureobasidium uvarum TaxID=2773716 RepID=A0A9N8KAW1_9PEZI|nr:unnamed protein product [Aureobasidium uvarum]